MPPNRSSAPLPGDTKGKGKGKSKANVTLCEVCKEKERKYKCPGCAAAYCSVPCFKTHKTICGVSVENSSTTRPSDSSIEPQDLTSSTPDISASLDNATNPISFSDRPHEVNPSTCSSSRLETDSLPPLLPPLSSNTYSRKIGANNHPLRPLSSLIYPPEPDEDIWIDPLRLEERERCVDRQGWLGIAQSPKLRQILSSESIRPLLRSIQSLPTPSSRSQAIARILGLNKEKLLTPVISGSGSKIRKGSSSAGAVNGMEEGFYLAGGSGWDGEGGSRGGWNGRGRGGARGAYSRGYDNRGGGGGGFRGARHQPYHNHNSDSNVAPSSTSANDKTQTPAPDPSKFWIGQEEMEAMKGFAECVREVLEGVEREREGERSGVRKVEWEL